MQTIWKFTLEATDEQTLRVPEGASALCVQVQRGVPCLWLQVDPRAKLSRLRVWTFGTGQPMDDPPNHYLGTYQMHNGEFVGHVFIEKID